ncbi:uncharacterized protein LOC100209092 isoform X1 [Hydra vulgaris]|uniref:uncharacterized protein LOC100209092 isoform X1 n=1 Tax=Hydra vulgaris TaxID=6087 RepID=UPI001F5EC201|nr:uncharacterized secreted protein ARB_06907 [Hydra vulgaris]
MRYVANFLVTLSFLGSSCSSKLTENDFIEENINALKLHRYKCQSLEVSFLFWLEKYESNEHAIFCALQVIKNKNIESKQAFWVFLHNIFTKKNEVKKAAFALKQLKNAKTLTISERWHFLGPFQIGKPEFDGNPAYDNKISIEKRWDSTFLAYSELTNQAIVKWVQVLSQNGVIYLDVNVNWNNLISSLQSMAVTEWQGVLVNDIVVTKDSDVQVQCLGVNVFYVNDMVINADVYHRQEYWYPLSLSLGIYTIKVPVRAKVNTKVKCSIEVLKKRSLIFHYVKFSPDLVSGNLFAPYVSILVSNMNPKETLSIKSLKTTSNDLIGLSAELFSNFEIYPGQISNIILKLTSSFANVESSCKNDLFAVNLLFKVSDGQEQEMLLNLRCREVNQSFLFTFIDHDGSVQHAAAIQPLSPCLLEKCPVLLTLHGTGVTAQNQADSYKYMKNGKFLFGVDKLWLLAPTRHGAHNWEGPGELTALTSVKELSMLTLKYSGYFSKCADSDLIVFAGHSMGGHGAWQVSVHNPDRALAVISGAGWLSKEDYGDSNLFYHFDVSISYIDPAIKLVQEACINENHADKHASNLKGIYVMIRVGADDKTVHPYFSRRMFRLLKANNVNVTYNEIKGKEHWWWDTNKPNDGGVTNDFQIRSFATNAVNNYERLHKTSECSRESCSQANGKLKYTKAEERRNFGNYHFVVFNPASFNGGRGIYVIQQKFPMLKSELKIEIKEKDVHISTINLLCIRVAEPVIDPVMWQEKHIYIDGFEIQKPNQELPWFLCLINGIWNVCEGKVYERDISTYGPARRIAENPFHISICDNGNNEESSVLLNSAIFLSNLFQSTSDTTVLIKRLNVLPDVILDNMILIGTENCTKHMGLRKLVNFTSSGLRIGQCHLQGENISALYLLPHNNRLILFLTAQNAENIRTTVLRSSFPTIPPMTRSPFSNLVPDYLIFSSEILPKGPGAFLCAGFWSNEWTYDIKTSSCTC